jgi:hypothetical protein
MKWKEYCKVVSWNSLGFVYGACADALRISTLNSSLARSVHLPISWPQSILTNFLGDEYTYQSLGQVSILAIYLDQMTTLHFLCQLVTLNSLLARLAYFPLSWSDVDFYTSLGHMSILAIFLAR